MTEDIVTTGEFMKYLKIRIDIVLEAVLPQAHVLEFALCLGIGNHPIWRTEGHH